MLYYRITKDYIVNLKEVRAVVFLPESPSAIEIKFYDDDKLIVQDCSRAQFEMLNEKLKMLNSV